MNVPPLPEAPEDSSAATPAPQAKRPARLLPRPRMGGLMPWVIAILIALVVIAASGGLVLRNLADNARADLAAAVTVQVIEPNPDLRAARGKAVVGVLQDMELDLGNRFAPDKAPLKMPSFFQMGSWIGGDRDALSTLDHHRALLPARHGGDLDNGGQFRRSGVEIITAAHTLYYYRHKLGTAEQQWLYETSRDALAELNAAFDAIRPAFEPVEAAKAEVA
jgi:hypothetical protein